MGQTHAKQKLSNAELHVLRAVYNDLTGRTEGKGIDKETFLQFFALEGLLGDRLFQLFDHKNSGQVGLDDFTAGISIASKGSEEDKLHFVFNIFDVSNKNKLSREDFVTLLNQIPKDALEHAYEGTLYEEAPALTATDTSQSESYTIEGFAKSFPPSKLTLTRSQSIKEVDNYTNMPLADELFHECNLLPTESLSYENFKLFISHHPRIMTYIEGAFLESLPSDIHPRISESAKPSIRLSVVESMKKLSVFGNGHIAKDVSPLPSEPHSPITRHSIADFRHFFSGHHVLARTNSCADISASRELEVSPLSNVEESSPTRELQPKPHEDSHEGFTHGQLTGMTAQQSVTKEGFLQTEYWGILRPKTQYLILSGSFLYYYARKSDKKPIGVIFLNGYLVSPLDEGAKIAKGLYGLELFHQDAGGQTLNCSSEKGQSKHVHSQFVKLYATSEEVRDQWLDALRQAAHVVPFEADFEMGVKLGQGAFGVVNECTRRKDGERFAVKVIEKASMTRDGHTFLQAEIAVLKVVHHPHVIRMEALHESKTHIYLVMELITGGDLLSRIQGQPRKTEVEAARVLRPLLEGVAYLHDLGIVHRDMKPDNVMCGNSIEDVKIIDFGLAKMVLPKDYVNTPVGTEMYAAPEVLILQAGKDTPAYGKEADLFSVGVITFVMLLGKYPIDNRDDMFRYLSCNNASMFLSAKKPQVWAGLSEDAKSFISSLLNATPSSRLTAREALTHPFILNGLDGGSNAS